MLKHALGEALKRHADKLKMSQGHPIDGSAMDQHETKIPEPGVDRAKKVAMSGSDHNSEDMDHAPEVSELGPDKVSQPIHGKQQDGEMDEAHAEIMQKLMDGHSSHPGRGPMSFDEKANASMKEKMAAIEQRKKGKGV